MRTRVTTVVAAAMLVPALAACSGTATPEATETSSAPASPSPTAPPVAEVGSCHTITLEQATRAVAPDEASVPCRQEHTSVTVAVQPVDLVADGHLLAPDSDTARQRLRRTCASGLDWVGGDQEARRLSRVEVVWFAPSDEQVAAGTDEVRCDLVAVAAQDRLLPLPARARGLLDREGALDTYGTCGTASPADPGFARVACAEPHAWRAVSSVDVPEGARFRGPAATQAADATCQDVASARADGSLEFTWAFEWPTRELWDAGQRYGLCWLPA